jgi:excisionase family DNA binding protein
VTTLPTVRPEKFADQPSNRTVRPPQKPLVGIEQAALFLSVTPRMVRRLWTLRQLAGVKVGRLVRFSEDDLSDYIARQRVEATQSPVAPVRVTRPLKAKTATKAVKSGGV